MSCRSLFVLLSFFFWPLCCLFFFDIRILITPLVSSTSYYYQEMSYSQNAITVLMMGEQRLVVIMFSLYIINAYILNIRQALCHSYVYMI